MKTIAGFTLMLLLIYGLIMALFFIFKESERAKTQRRLASTEKYFMEDQK